VANAVERNKNRDPEVLVSYNAPARQYKVNNIFACQPLDGKCCPGNLKRGALWAEFEKEFQQKSRPIVLIGGTYEHRDYPTPIGRQPALIIDAYAVQAELNHTYVKDFPAWLKFIFDIPLGLASGWLVQRFAKDSVRRGMQISFLIAALIIVVNVCLIHAGILWFSFAGVAFRRHAGTTGRAVRGRFDGDSRLAQTPFTGAVRFTPRMTSAALSLFASTGRWLPAVSYYRSARWRRDPSYECSLSARAGRSKLAVK
jgi:hypothetical protein